MKEEGRPGKMRIRWYTLLAACAVALSACGNAPVAAPQSPTRAAAPPATQPPAAPVAASPTALAATAANTNTGPRTVTFQTEDGITLSGTLFGKGEVGVVLSHMFPTDQTSWHAFAQALADDGYLALAYDFRGYGQSGGEKRVDQIDRDVRAAAAFLRGQGAQRIVLIGASMGGTASVKAAGSVRADALVVISSPQSFEGLTASEDDLKSFEGPSLWIGSRNDTATPGSEAMYALANEPKALHIYEGSAHGTYIFDTGDGPDLTRRLIDFVASSLPPKL